MDPRIRSSLSHVQRFVDQKYQELYAAKKQLETSTKRHEGAVSRHRAAQEAQVIVQELSKQIQVQVHSQISTLVTDCLKAVFPNENYTFQIRFETKRNKTEAVLVFERDGLELADPLSQAGGGVIDVASFALRVAALLLSRPSLRPVLILDEPFRFVSREYRQNLVDLIEELHDKLEIQFVMVTHIEELKTGTTIELKKDD